MQHRSLWIWTTSLAAGILGSAVYVLSPGNFCRLNSSPAPDPQTNSRNTLAPYRIQKYLVNWAVMPQFIGLTIPAFSVLPALAQRVKIH
jgi:hypothetical protein